MAYADYTYYSGTYGGSMIPQTEFTVYANKASAFIDYVTFGEAEDVSPVTDALKNAMCAVAEVKYGYQSGEMGLASESVGSVSRTYISGVQSQTQAEYDAVQLYLSNTGLLYQGVSHAHKL